jgi:hypothetical protein
MSGNDTKSFLFRDSTGKTLVAAQYTENDESLVCMNGAIMPFLSLREIISAKDVNGGIACTTMEGAQYFIPNISMELLSQAMIDIR